MNASHTSSYYKTSGKRVVDLLFSIHLLLIGWPIILIIIVILYSSNEGQIVFKQLRPGRNGVPFWIYKFKTMSDETDSDGNLLPDFQRIHTIGKWIRSCSLDELPQIINILKGEMSLIGPRPLLMEYLNLYSNNQQKRHLVKPGITGLAQIKGRNKLSWKHSLKYDSWYSDHCTFGLDLKIFFITIKNVFLKKDIDAGKNITRPPFKG